MAVTRFEAEEVLAQATGGALPKTNEVLVRDDRGWLFKTLEEVSIPSTVAFTDQDENITGAWDFDQAPTVGGTTVSLEGHGHPFSEITGTATRGQLPSAVAYLDENETVSGLWTFSQNILGSADIFADGKLFAGTSPLTHYGLSVDAPDPQFGGHISGNLFVEHPTDVEIVIEAHDTNPSVHFQRMSSTDGVPTVADGKTLGALAPFAWDGSEFAQGSAIAFELEEDVTPGSVKDRIAFYAPSGPAGGAMAIYPGGLVRVQPGVANFDVNGTQAFSVSHLRSASSPGTAGGTNHGSIFELEIDTALTTPSTALLTTVRPTHASGTMTGGLIAHESFVEARGSGSADELIGTISQLTMFESIDVTRAMAFKVGAVNANGAWTGTLDEAYGLYVDDLDVGAIRYSIWTQGDHPSRFGGRLVVGDAIASAVSHIELQAQDGVPGRINVTRDGDRRWAWGATWNGGTDEWSLSRFNDLGVFLGSALVVDRQNGVADFEATPTVGGLDVLARLDQNETVLGQWTFVGTDHPIILDKPAGTAAVVRFAEAGVRHWQTGRDGSMDDNFVLFRYNDSGVFVDAPILVDRGTGIVQFKHELDLTPLAASAPAVKVNATDALVSADPTTDAPAGFIKVEFEGATRHVPVY